jgi:hypothetical protein
MGKRKVERPVKEEAPVIQALTAEDESRREFLASLDPRQRAVLSWDGE